jgi:hypothetical protein
LIVICFSCLYSFVFKGKESSVVIQGETDDIAIGALTLELISIQPLNFDRYFNALKPNIAYEKMSDDDENNDNDISRTNSERWFPSRNPWFNQFWEHRFNCNLRSSSSCSQQQLNETNWDSKLQFIVDATYVFAQALHMYFNCTSSICYNVSFNHIDGKRLFRIILEKTFSSMFNSLVLFVNESTLPIII